MSREQKAVFSKTMTAGLAGLTMLAGVGDNAAPAFAAGIPVVTLGSQSPVEQFKDHPLLIRDRHWNGRRQWDGGWNGGRWHGNGWNRHHHNHSGAYLGAGIAGLATGALLGGLFAGPGYGYYWPGFYGSGYYGQRYYGSGYYYNRPYIYRPPLRYVVPGGGYAMWSPAWYSYCESRYRSFDPGSGTFLGYDGLRHYCR